MSPPEPDDDEVCGCPQCAWDPDDESEGDHGADGSDACDGWDADPDVEDVRDAGPGPPLAFTGVA